MKNVLKTFIKETYSSNMNLSLALPDEEGLCSAQQCHATEVTFMVLKKLVIDLQEAHLADFDKLLKRTGFTSRKDLFNDMWAFYDHMLTNVERGGSLPRHETAEGREVDVAGTPFVKAKKHYEERAEPKTGM